MFGRALRYNNIMVNINVEPTIITKRSKLRPIPIHHDYYNSVKEKIFYFVSDTIRRSAPIINGLLNSDDYPSLGGPISTAITH